MKTEGFGGEQIKPINIDGSPNPYKSEGDYEIESLIQEIRGRIAEINTISEKDPSRGYELKDMLEDMKEELGTLELTRELDAQDKLKIDSIRDEWAAAIFSGKDNTPDIKQ